MKQRIKIRIKGLLSYLAVFFCNGLLWWYFRSYFNFIIAVLMAVGAVLSIVLFCRCRDSFRAEVSVPKTCMDKRGTVVYAIRVTSGAPWGRFPAAVTYSLGNAFSGRKDTETFRTRAYGGGQNGESLSRHFRALYYGRYGITLEKCLFYDFFGLVYCACENLKDSWVMVAPSEDVTEEQAAEILLQHLPDDLGGRKGLDYSADYEIRDYQPGDDLRSIHWKLSARQGHLMVRERMSDGKPKVNLLLYPSRDQYDNDLRIELLNRLGKALLAAEYPVGVFWWNQKEQALRAAFVTSQEELEMATHEILSGNGFTAADGLMDLFVQEFPHETALAINRTHNRTSEVLQPLPDIVLLKGAKEKTFTWTGVLAKAVLITALVFGGIGGFLSAYDIKYQNVFCLGVIFVIALVTGILYDYEKRLWINLGLIVFMIGFLVFVAQFYWYLNSGYHVILNEVFHDARSYLGIFDGTEFIINVEDEYAAVTYFVLFIALIEILLLQMRFSRKISLGQSLLFTVPLLAVPLYFEECPKTGFLLLLLGAYFAIALVSAAKVKKQLSGQLGFALLAALVLAVGGGRLVMALVPLGSYQKMVSTNEFKKNSEEVIGRIVQYGPSMFLFADRGGGISGGFLSRGGTAMPDYETDLIVEYTPYSANPVYLKAFVGKDYHSMRWMPDTEDFLTEETAEGLQELENAGWGMMQIRNVGASREYRYYPYYTKSDILEEYGDRYLNSYVYYPYNKELFIETAGVDESYLVVPDSCRSAVSKFCREGQFSGTPEEMAVQVVDYFEEHYAYTLNPGYMWRSSDFITNFLSYSKKGYCMHFASSAVMVYRNLGIPARYVEGYVFSYSEALARGELVEDANYEDYYNGYSELGETGVIRLEIPDANAHAWVEIYLQGKGWVVVDPTPSASEDEEDEDSFWDAFGDGGNDILDAGIFNPETAAFLTKTAGNAMKVFVVLIAGYGIFLLIRWGYRKRKESLLPPRERLMLEYRRTVERFAKRGGMLSSSDTIHDQLEKMEQLRRNPYGPARRKKIERQLYQVFYGGELEVAEYEKLLRELQRK